MASPYPALARAARTVIAKYGRPVTLVRVADGAPDPAKPWEPSAPVEAPYATTAVFATAAKEFATGTTILSADETVLVPAADVPFEVTSKDYVLDGTARLAIVKSDQIAPGDTPLVFQLIVRR